MESLGSQVEMFTHERIQGCALYSIETDERTEHDWTGQPSTPKYRACTEPSQRDQGRRRQRINEKDFRQRGLSAKLESSVGSHKIVNEAPSLNP